MNRRANRGVPANYFADAPVNTFEDAAMQERSDTHHTSATNATPRPASTLSRALGPRGRLGFAHEPAGAPSASAGLSQAQREQLHAARVINLGAIE